MILFRHFRIEENLATGQQRVVSYCADPETMRPVRDDVGEWVAPLDPLRRLEGRQLAQTKRLLRRRAAQEGFDPAEVGARREADEGEDEGGEDGGRWL